MSFPKYPAYKDSGVVWIGKVPVGWNIKPIKRVAQLHTEKSNNSIFPVALENIQSKTGKFISSDTEFEGEGVSFQKGDILFGKLRPYLAKVWLADKVGEAVGDFHVISPISCNGDFLRWILISDEVISQIDGSTFGAKMPRASWDFISQFSVPLPSVSEQQAIASFLDRECGKIDALIAEQERLIALLAEKRQAAISHAVTKGLNPNAPMKDSGIPWIGMVPEGWEMKRLKTISPYITVGIVVNPSEYISDSGLPYIYGGDISEEKIALESCRRITHSNSQKQPKSMLAAGDLVTVRVGAPGVTAVVPEVCNGGNCASVMLIRKGNFNSKWLCYVMNSRIVRFQVEMVQYGAAQEQFNIGHAINFWAPVPTKKEQFDIASFLERETGQLNQLSDKAKSAIFFLKERRAALISAAVTGKIDVRAQSKAIAA